MINRALHTFAATLIRVGRIQSDDVKRLCRDFLPDGISSREEAELLLRLDHSVSRADPSFAAWLVTAMVDFVVWGARPTGYVDPDAAQWLGRVLMGSRGPTRTALVIAREVIREAQGVDEALLASIGNDVTENAPGTEAVQRRLVPPRSSRRLSDTSFHLVARRGPLWPRSEIITVVPGQGSHGRLARVRQGAR